MPITATYAALLAFLFVALSIRVIRSRRGARVAIGDGGNAILLRRMRVQANFAEYVPLALILLGLAESLRSPSLLLHAAGIVLVGARLVHAVGVSRPDEDFRLRVAGMTGTLTVILGLGLLCLWGGLR